MEMLYTVAGWRAPFVLVNVSRGLAAPLTLESDHNDIMAARDSGFLQIHCATCQEVLDSILLAYRLAEDSRVRLPVIVNLDGFYLSFTREPVFLPELEEVRKFLPPFDPDGALRDGRQHLFGGDGHARHIQRAEPVQPRHGEEGRVGAGLLQLLQAGLHVAAELHDLQIGPLVDIIDLNIPDNAFFINEKQRSFGNAIGT